MLYTSILSFKTSLNNIVSLTSISESITAVDSSSDPYKYDLFSSNTGLIISVYAIYIFIYICIYI